MFCGMVSVILNHALSVQANEQIAAEMYGRREDMRTNRNGDFSKDMFRRLSKKQAGAGVGHQAIGYPGALSRKVSSIHRNCADGLYSFGDLSAKCCARSGGDAFRNRELSKWCPFLMVEVTFKRVGSVNRIGPR